jgi:thioredoxin 1
MKKILVAAALSAVVISVPLYLKRRPAPVAAHAEPVAAAAARRVPRLVDLGTTSCAPCKAMLVVVAELERAYADQLAVEFVNVQQDEEASRRYGIKVIPTQVFLDPDGKELFRHTGFYATEAIVAKWRELGYPLDRRSVGG